MCQRRLQTWPAQGLKLMETQRGQGTPGSSASKEGNLAIRQHQLSLGDVDGALPRRHAAVPPGNMAMEFSNAPTGNSDCLSLSLGD